LFSDVHKKHYDKPNLQMTLGYATNTAYNLIIGLIPDIVEIGVNP